MTPAGLRAKAAWILSQPSPLEQALAFLRQIAGDAAPAADDEDGDDVRVAA